MYLNNNIFGNERIRKKIGETRNRIKNVHMFMSSEYYNNHYNMILRNINNYHYIKLTKILHAGQNNQN